MAKKQKKLISERVPTKGQLSKWQRQEKIRRIVIIAAIVFLVGIGIVVGRGLIEDYKSDPLRQVVIKVNGVPFTMGYFVEIFDAYTQGVKPEEIRYMADYIASMVADEIIRGELLRQGAKSLNIIVSDEEVETTLQKYGLANNQAYRDIITRVLLEEKLKEYFGSQLSDTMEQAHLEVMLVESREVAYDVIAEVDAGGNFTALAAEFSCNSTIEGDLGWLPEELMPNTLIAGAAFNLTLGEVSQPIYDETAVKNVGYWLIEVTEKQGNEIKARAMLLGSKAEAEQVKTELTSGNFSSLAKEYSQHKSKDEGGELGWLKQGSMNSMAFDQVAFNITLNEVSEPVKDESVQTIGGYWLVKVVDRGERELEEETKEELIDKRFSEWFEEWKKNSTIENHLDEGKMLWALNKVLEGR